jgi:dihydroceramidase
MFLAVGTLLHQLFTFDASPSRRKLVTTLILGSIIPASIYHCWTNEIIVHEIVFGVMVILCGRKIRWLIKEKIPNEESRKRLSRMANLGSGKPALFYLVLVAVISIEKEGNGFC